MFAIEVETVFSAAHALRLPGGKIEPLHGHDFRATVRIACQTLDAMETVIDFHPVEAALEKIVAPWRSGNLNEIEPFCAATNPSAERIAETIGRAMQAALAALLQGAGEPEARQLHITEVRLTEAPHCLAIWMPDPSG